MAEIFTFLVGSTRNLSDFQEVLPDTLRFRKLFIKFVEVTTDDQNIINATVEQTWFRNYECEVIGETFHLLENPTLFNKKGI